MYVEAYSGDDAVGTGEISSPVATVDKALEIVKNKVSGGYKGAAQILLGSGIYNVSETISVENNEVPAGGLVIGSRYGEKATIAGGVNYSVKDAYKVEDEATLSRLLTDDAKANLYALDLTSKIALEDIPAVSYPGSYNVNDELIALGLENPSEQTAEASIDGNMMTVARYPNSGYAEIGAIVDEGVEARLFDTTLAVTEENIYKGFEFKSDYENLSNWQTADQALMFGYWYHDWATQTVPLKEVNVADGTIRSKYPSTYKVKAGQRYYIFNLLEEIDMPGEYFIDRKTGIMYFYMPENATDNSEITLATEEYNLITLNGTKKPVVVENLILTSSLDGALSFYNSDGAVLQNCEISNTASTAVGMWGTNNTVQNCYFHDVNAGVWAGTNKGTSFVAVNNKVINNEFTRFSRINKTYTPAIQISGVGNIVSHNKIYDGEHTAIMFSGCKHEISYNDISDVCKEVDDSGAIYVGRSWTSRDNKIMYNYIHDIKSSDENGGSPVAGVFMDDHFADVHLEGNVFANIAGDGIRGNGGREHTITNNIFVNCTLRGTVMTDSNPENGDFSTQINGVKNYIGNTAFENEYPILFTKDDEGNTVVNTEELIYPKDHVYTNNLMVGCGTGYDYRPLATQYAKDITTGNYVTATDPGFYDMANGDFRIALDKVQALIPNFKAVPFAEMGLIK